MLFAHEVHHVIGAKEAEFEAAYRDEWLPMLAKDDDARLLWFTRRIHGTAHAYTLITLTAVRDGAAWQRLAERVQHGDLREWFARVDSLRHELTAKLLLPVFWSPMQEIDFADVPSSATEHEPSIYMEDTGWPHAPLDDYIAFWERGYHQPMQARPAAQRLLDVQAVFQPAYGAGPRKEAILWQKVLDHQRLLDLLTTEPPPERTGPGSFMHEALAYRDHWESRLLRTAIWSPLW